MYKRLYDFLEGSKLFHKYQFGFRKKSFYIAREVLDNIYQHCSSQEVTM